MWKHWKIRSLLSLLVQGSPLREPAGPCSVSGSSSLRGYMLVTVTLSGLTFGSCGSDDSDSKFIVILVDSECFRTCNLTIAYSFTTSHKWCKCEQVVPTRALTLCTVHRNAGLTWICNSTKSCNLGTMATQWVLNADCALFGLKVLPNILATKVEGNNGSQ